MRVRALDQNGDYTFGQGSANFLVNSPAAVAQSIQTALLLLQGEWFLDVTVGVPWLTQVVGMGTQPTYDTVIKQAILGVQGVTAIQSYSSSLNRATRTLTVTATVATQFSTTGIIVTTSIPVPVGFGYGGGQYGVQGYGT